MIPEILLGIALCIACLYCIQLYGQRENLARENSELLLQIEMLQSGMRAAQAARWIHGSTGDNDLDRVVGSDNSDGNKGV